jgi:hypothetical protein
MSASKNLPLARRFRLHRHSPFFVVQFAQRQAGKGKSSAVASASGLWLHGDELARTPFDPHFKRRQTKTKEEA